MKPWKTVSRAPAPGGEELLLQERDGEWVIRSGGHVLMTSRTHRSEEALAEAACGGLRTARGARVLVGGLGCGYTLRAALDLLPATAEVSVAELSPAVVEWNRGPLAPLAGAPLEDPRVRLKLGDAAAAIREARGSLDAILLDVDNGPSALSAPENEGLYDEVGVAMARAALRRGGVFAVWSAGPDARFARRLAETGFDVKVLPVPARSGGRGGRHVIFVGRAS